MSKAIDVHLSHLRFPPTGVVCMAPAPKAYELQKNITDKHKSLTVKVNVPMCDRHFQLASFSGMMEKWMSRLGMTVGILTVLFVAILSLVRGEGMGQGNVFKLLAMGTLGLDLVLMLWTIISLSLAPFLAAGVSQAHRAVRLRRYWPEDQFVRLEFQDEQLADIVQNTY